MRRFFPALLIFLAGFAAAQDFPNKPVHLIAPFAPGGALDLIARGLGAKLSESLGQPVVVENRAGASGAIGSEAVARSAPDGYTLLLGATTTHGINPAFNPKSLPYDAVKDFTPVSLVATIPHALVVNPRLPVNSVQDLVKLGKQRSLNYGSAGNGSPHHLAAELFKSLTGIQAVHVPYKGGAPASVDVMAGRIAYYFAGMPVGLPLHKSGKVRALAVTSKQRFSGAPDVPTVAEQGLPDYEATLWQGFFAPASLPADVAARIAADIEKVVALPETHEKLAGANVTVYSAGQAEFKRFFSAEIDKWRGVVKKANLKLQ
jgi:tripartite-type tricarboxylate transporter receptor subunit TctC